MLLFLHTVFVFVFVYEYILYILLPGICLEAYHWGLRPLHMPPAVQTGALPSHTLPGTGTHREKVQLDEIMM